VGFQHTRATVGGSARSAQSGGQEVSGGRPRGCVGDLEGIMNGGAATAFLPNFVGFPSLRGLHSSTVQLRRAPRQPERTPEHRSEKATSGGVRPDPGPDPRPRVPPLPRLRMRFPLPELSCPVSAASPASAPASSAAAGRPATTGRPTAAGVTSVVPAGVRRASAVSGPPAAAAAGAAAAVQPPAPPASLPAVGPADRRQEQNHEENQQDDAENHGHGVILLSVQRPRSGPPWAPRSLRELEMPLRLTTQSRVEELQSLGAG